MPIAYRTNRQLTHHGYSELACLRDYIHEIVFENGKLLPLANERLSRLDYQRDYFMHRRVGARYQTPIRLMGLVRGYAPAIRMNPECTPDND